VRALAAVLSLYWLGLVVAGALAANGASEAAGPGRAVHAGLPHVHLVELSIVLHVDAPHAPVVSNQGRAAEPHEVRWAQGRTDGATTSISGSTTLFLSVPSGMRIDAMSAGEVHPWPNDEGAPESTADPPPLHPPPDPLVRRAAD
jgi:hypothetical protein